MSFYAPPDQIDQVDYAMDVGSKMLEYMEEFFGIKYPLPKAGKNLLLQRAKLLQPATHAVQFKLMELRRSYPALDPLQLWGARAAQWWEHLPPGRHKCGPWSNPGLTIYYVGRLCWWLLSLTPRGVIPWVKQLFQIPIRPRMVDEGPLCSKSLLIWRPFRFCVSDVLPCCFFCVSLRLTETKFAINASGVFMD